MSNSDPPKRLAKVLLMAAVLLIILLPVITCGPLYRGLGGRFAGAPSDIPDALSPGAKNLLAKTINGLEPGPVVDTHVHLLGLGAGGTGAWVNPEMDSLLHPFNRARFRIYLSAAGIHDMEKADAEYLGRLLALIKNMGIKGRYLLLALDRAYTKDGRPDLEHTPFYIPNEYVYRMAGQYREFVVPVVSVHPYRKDAVETLEAWAARGARFVKWLPNAMGIDPSDPDIDPYYEVMARHKMVLITHTGRELSVSADSQVYGNPLLLRRPLDMGVTVIAAHCASFGDDADLDQPEQPMVPSFDLFLRLMDDERYRGLLFGDISGITFFNHLDRPLRILLERPDLHDRLVNGSDYPLPGLNILVQTGRLHDLGYISGQERNFLNEIYSYNPLLFDLALKRIVRHPKTGQGFSPSIFLGETIRPWLEDSAPPPSLRPDMRGRHDSMRNIGDMKAPL